MTLRAAWRSVPVVSVFQKRLIDWDCHTQPSLELAESGLKKRIYPLSSSCVDENSLLT